MPGLQNTFHCPHLHNIGGGGGVSQFTGESWAGLRRLAGILVQQILRVVSSLQEVMSSRDFWQDPLVIWYFEKIKKEKFTRILITNISFPGPQTQLTPPIVQSRPARWLHPLTRLACPNTASNYVGTTYLHPPTNDFSPL